MQREHVEDATTRATARLPGLEIEIVHQRPSPDAEHISIHLRAAPSFEAFGQWLEVDQPICTLDSRPANGVVSLARGCGQSKAAVERARKWPQRAVASFDSRLSAVVQMRADGT